MPLKRSQSLRTLRIFRGNAIHVLELYQFKVLLMMWHLNLYVFNGHLHVAFIDLLDLCVVDLVRRTCAIGCLLLQFNLGGMHHLFSLGEDAAASSTHGDSIGPCEVLVARITCEIPFYGALTAILLVVEAKSDEVLWWTSVRVQTGLHVITQVQW